MIVGQLQAVDQAQHLVEIASGAGRVDDRGADLLVRVDDIDRPDGELRVGVRVDHVVERRHFPLGIGDDRELNAGILGLFDILDPALVVLDAVDRYDQRLGAALGEFILQPGRIAELGRANRCEIGRVGEEDNPVLAGPFVKFDPAFRRVGFKVGGNIANEKAHNSNSCHLISGAKMVPKDNRANARHLKVSISFSNGPGRASKKRP